MLVAYELRETLFPESEHSDDLRTPTAKTRPPVSKMLEALTHRSCHDAIDCERYELLGDSVLRFSTALDIFRCRDEEEDEGGMTMTIDLRVANGTLFRIAQVCGPPCQRSGLAVPAALVPYRTDAPSTRRLTMQENQ